MQSIDKLKLEINKLLKEEFDNTELKKSLNESFASKNLNLKTIHLLFEGKKFVEQLNDYELIAFCKGAYNIFRSNKNLRPDNYFSAAMLESYKNYISVTEEINTMHFKNFIQVNDFEYYGNITYEDVYKYMNNNLILYTLDIQRSPTFKKLGSGYIKTATIDSKAVKNIEDTVLKGELETTQIVLTLLVDDKENIPRFEFRPKFENVGDVIIDQPISLNDGMHRCLGICSAVAKHLAETNEYLEGSISVRFIIADQVRARRVMQQSFLRSNTNADFLKAITESDVSLFLDKVIAHSKALKGNVANTFEEAKAMKKRTYRTILLDILNKTNINFNNKSEVLIKSRSIAECIDTLYDLSENKHDVNLTAMYLWFAYKMQDKEEDVDLYYRIIDKMDNMTEQEIKSLKVNNKSVSVNALIKYFNDIFEEGNHE